MTIKYIAKDGTAFDKENDCTYYEYQLDIAKYLKYDSVVNIYKIGGGKVQFSDLLDTFYNTWPEINVIDLRKCNDKAAKEVKCILLDCIEKNQYCDDVSCITNNVIWLYDDDIEEWVTIKDAIENRFKKYNITMDEIKAAILQKN